MLEILREVGLDPTQFLTLLAVCAIALILAYRPFIFSLVDPLNVFILSMCACSVLMFGMNWDSSVKIEFALFIFFFWLGFAFAGRIPRHHPAKHFHPPGLQDLEIVLVLLCAIIVVANLYLGFTAGFPLFSADPTISKVTTYQGGLGLVRHVNSAFLFLCCGCIVLIALGHKRALALVLLATGALFTALSGSKGALLPIIFALAFVIHHNGLRQNTKNLSRLKKFLLPSFGAAVAIALIVVVKDNRGIAGGLIFMAKRLLFFGDIILFYYPRRGAIPELMGVNSLDYISYLFDPILGMFRIKDYSYPLGTIIAGDLDAGFGPNVQYFVRADIFFGPIFGCVYCLIIGYLVGFLRNNFFRLRTNNVMLFTFALTLAVSAFAVATESQFFVSFALDSFLIVCPLWVFAYLARMAALASHRIPNSTT